MTRQDIEMKIIKHGHFGCKLLITNAIHDTFNMTEVLYVVVIVLYHVYYAFIKFT